MKPIELNIEQAFDAIENISLSDNWDFAFEQKLNNSRKSKSIKISKINIAVIILVFINIGFILNLVRTDSTQQETARKADLEIIAQGLLGTNN